MGNYSIFTDFEKQKLLKKVADEYKRLKKPKYWILERLGISKSTYHDWLKTGGITKSKAPHKVWNKTSKEIEDEIIKIRDNLELYRSERAPNGIARQLEEKGMFMTSTGVWKVLNRNGKSRDLKAKNKIFIIYPRGEKFLDVVCIDDIMLSNEKPRDLAIFNAVDEYSRESVAISFVLHRSNQHDVIGIIKQIKTNYGRLPKTIRLDNARAHKSILVKKYCEKNNIKLQFIDPGTPQQNWPVETFNGVIRKDLIKTCLIDWDNYKNNDILLEEYREYYNTKKLLNSDPLKRTPREISTGITSKTTQIRLKVKLLRKHKGQVIAREYTLNNYQLFCQNNLSEMCVN